METIPNQEGKESKYDEEDGDSEIRDMWCSGLELRPHLGRGSRRKLDIGLW